MPLLIARDEHGHGSLLTKQNAVLLGQTSSTHLGLTTIIVEVVTDSTGGRVTAAKLFETTDPALVRTGAVVVTGSTGALAIMSGQVKEGDLTGWIVVRLLGITGVITMRCQTKTAAV